LLTSLEYEDKKVQDWAYHKKEKIIKAGLNKACSKIPEAFFDILRDHTNSVEQSHQKSYAGGIYLTLTEAVKK
jgi:hypothetical protein